MAAIAKASKNLFSFLSLLVFFTSLATSQPDFVHSICEDNNGNYTANSTYHSNLNTLLSNLSSDIGTSNNFRFYNISNGENTDKVNLIWMCRGDVTKDDCLSCLNNSRILLPEVCPNQKEATGFYDYCMLRYSSQSIFGVLDSNMWAIHNLRNVNDVNDFNQVAGDLMQSLRSKAAAVSGDSSLVKFAAGKAKVGSGFETVTVYAHVQCTNDLSELQCNDCLVGEISYIPTCCNGTVRARVFAPSCNLRYDTTPYFDSLSGDLPPQPSPSPTPTPSSTTDATVTLKQGKNSSSATVIAIVVTVVSLIIVLLITFVCIYFKRKKKPTKYSRSQGALEADDCEFESTETLQFDFQTMVEATNNFSVANKLGEGGFGLVYKGRLPNGEEVAIKRLSRNSQQGDIEFKNELLLVAKLQHRNLARLLGFCLETGERMLVYEFLPNKSLDYFIFDPIKRLILDWDGRYKIIVGIARGLLYLHEDSQLRIIHRDLKASNILLDDNMNAKISDFGMARLFVEDQTQGNTLRVVGTLGYIAPEYASNGHFSIKSDVFSFGVLLLEIVSGRRNGDIHNGEEYAEHLISFIWRKWNEDSGSDIVDPTLDSRFRNQIMRCIHIGLLCVQENVADRPSMATVAMMLNSDSLTLPMPSRAAYAVMNNAGDSSNSERLGESRNYALQESSGANEASITELYPR